MENYTHNIEEKKSRSSLDEMCKNAVEQMLAVALAQEVKDFTDRYQSQHDERGRHLVVRNGYMPERKLLTGVGIVKIKQPRVDDRAIRGKGFDGFCSSILPKHIRRAPSIDNLLPVLYLKGISTGDFCTVLAPLLGERAKNLSPNVVSRLKEVWEKEYVDWSHRDLSEENYIYLWVDGVNFGVRMEDEKACTLVAIGTKNDGKKQLLALQDGYRESTESWKALIRNLKARGLKQFPKLAVGDGAAGFWSALSEEFPTTRRQNCWVHKTRNVLDKLPKRIQPKAKSLIHQMYLVDTKKEALQSFDLFCNEYSEKYPDAVKCLMKDKESMFTFYDFPKEHWKHIRTTNPIESTFSTVRLRTYKTRGCCKRTTVIAMAFKLVKEAEKNWNRLKGYKFISLLLEGKIFEDGELKKVA